MAKVKVPRVARITCKDSKLQRNDNSYCNSFLTKTSNCHWRLTLVEVRNPTMAANDYKISAYRINTYGHSTQPKYLKEFEESHCWSTVFILGVQAPDDWIDLQIKIWSNECNRSIFFNLYLPTSLTWVLKQASPKPSIKAQKTAMYTLWVGGECMWGRESWKLDQCQIQNVLYNPHPLYTCKRIDLLKATNMQM